MALISKRFSGDQKLEAAATLDQAHIIRGSSGVHVAKIQSALIELDGAAISVQELRQAFYGDSTASAVLAFKKKRHIINPSYQTQADDIVGKMTIAALDKEISIKERVPVEPARIEPLSSIRRVNKIGRPPQIKTGSTLSFNFAVSSLSLAPKPALDSVGIDIEEQRVGTFRVLNGIGGTLVCDPKIAVIIDPEQFTAPNSVPVTKNPQVFNVRGVSRGATAITLIMPFSPLLTSPALLPVFVRSPRGKVIGEKDFVRGIEHNHPPSGRWSEISSNPDNAGGGISNEGGNNEGGIFNGTVLSVICQGCKSPECVIEKVIAVQFARLPVAKDHIDWYLRKGGGRDFVEDGLIATWIKNDKNIRRVLREQLDTIPVKSGQKRTHFEFHSTQFDDKDFNFAFGSIDRVDVMFDFDLDEFTVWFQDRYEWHPFYPKIYNEQAGDEKRSTNCLHAAFVEMKLKGARDFWMKGQDTLPMEIVFQK